MFSDQYYSNVVIIFDVLMYTLFIDLVKRGVLTLVGEMWRYKKNRYYYCYIQVNENC